MSESERKQGGGIEIAEARERMRTWAAAARARSAEQPFGTPLGGAVLRSKPSTWNVGAIQALFRGSWLAVGCFTLAALSYSAGYFHGLDTTRAYLEQSERRFGSENPTTPLTAALAPLPLPDLEGEPPRVEKTFLAAAPVPSEPEKPALGTAAPAATAKEPPAQPKPSRQRAAQASKPALHLQVAAFRSNRYAQALRQRLSEQGFQTLMRPGPRGLYVIYVGPFQDEPAARAGAARLKAIGLEALLRRL